MTPYSVRSQDRLTNHLTLSDARKRLMDEFKSTGGIRTGVVMQGSRTVGYVTPNPPIWVEIKNGIEMYSPLLDDGSIPENAVPTDVPPGEEPTYCIKGGPAFKHLETARRYLASLKNKEDGFFAIFNKGQFVEEHLFDDNGHHYVTMEEFTLESADKRTYYKVNKIGSPTKQKYDDWKIDGRYRKT